MLGHVGCVGMSGMKHTECLDAIYICKSMHLAQTQLKYMSHLLPNNWTYACGVVCCRVPRGGIGVARLLGRDISHLHPINLFYCLSELLHSVSVLFGVRGVNDAAQSMDALYHTHLLG